MHRGHHLKLASKKHHGSDRNSGTYGLYNPGTLDDKILRHGQKVMGSNALGSY